MPWLERAKYECAPCWVLPPRYVCRFARVLCLSCFSEGTSRACACIRPGRIRNFGCLLSLQFDLEELLKRLTYKCIRITIKILIHGLHGHDFTPRCIQSSAETNLSKWMLFSSLEVYLYSGGPLPLSCSIHS